MTTVERGPARPAAPRLGDATRSAAVDVFYNSWRLVPANVLWSAGFLTLLILWEAGTPLFSVLGAPLLALPTIGLYRMAALVTRGDAVSLSDAFDAWRQFGGRALALGGAFTLLVTVFGANVLLGLDRGDVLGWVIATTAAWGLVITALCACVVWPLAADPRRETLGFRAIVRLALLMVVAFPLRMGALAVLIAVVLVASTIGFVALVTISVAFVALLATRFVLPAADRFEPLKAGGSDGGAAAQEAAKAAAPERSPVERDPGRDRRQPAVPDQRL